MFLKCDVIMIVQKWGSMPPHTGLETGLACTNADRSGNKDWLRVKRFLFNQGVKAYS